VREAIQDLKLSPIGRAVLFFKQNALFFVVLLTAIALRVITLGGKGLWLDEAYSVHLARQGFGDLIRQLSLESTPPLYYLCLHFWMDLFGSGEAAVRALSLLFSLGTLAVLYAIGRRFFSRPVAVAAAALAAFSPLQVYYGQETRMYSLLAFLAACLLYFTVRIAAVSTDAPAGPGSPRRAAIGMGITGLLMLYTHTVALWFVAACFIAALYFARDRKARVPVLLSMSGTILAFLPWALVLIQQVARQATVLQWFVPFWESKPVWRHAIDSLSSFSFGPFPPYLSLKSPGDFLIMGAVLLAAILVWGLVAGRRSPAVKACGLIGLLAFGVPLVYSRLFQPIYIPGRTDQYLQPIFLLLAAAGIMALSGQRLIRTGIVLLFCALSIWTLIPYYGNFEKDSSRAYMEEVRDIAAAGDTLIATGYTVATSEYYALKWKIPVALFTYPLALASHPGFFNAAEEAGRPNDLARDANTLAAKLTDATARGNKGILLATPHEINEILRRALEYDFRLDDVPGRQNRHEALVGTPVRVLSVRKRAPNPPRP